MKETPRSRKETVLVQGNSFVTQISKGGERENVFRNDFR